MLKNGIVDDTNEGYKFSDLPGEHKFVKEHFYKITSCTFLQILDFCVY